MQDLLSVVNLASLYFLFAVGLSLVWGTTGVLNFAHGAVFMFAAFAASWAVGKSTIGFVPIALIGMMVGAALAMAIQTIAFDQVLRRASSLHSAEMQILIAGIGLAIVPVAIVEHETQSIPFGFSASSFDVTSWTLGEVRITSISAITIGIAVLLWALTASWLTRSRNGLALRALGQDPDIASVMGINGRRLTLAAMAFAGATAGLAGVLLTFSLGALTPHSGDLLLVKAFACVILGGVGSMRGIAFGCVFLAGAETLVLTQTSGAWVDAVSFGLIFLVLLLKPSGVFGRSEVRRT